MIIILKRKFCRARWNEALAQKMATTWWREFKRKSDNALSVHLQESRKKALYWSTATPQWKHSWNDRSRLGFVGRSAVGKQQQFSKFSWQNWSDFQVAKVTHHNVANFCGRTEKSELFEDLFQTSLKVYNQLTEDDRVNYFHSFIKGGALETFKILTAQPKRIWEELWQFSLGST